MELKQKTTILETVVSFIKNIFRRKREEVVKMPPEDTVNPWKLSINGEVVGEIKCFQSEVIDIEEKETKSSEFTRYINGFNGTGTFKIIDRKYLKRVRNRQKLYEKRKALGRV